MRATQNFRRSLRIEFTHDFASAPFTHTDWKSTSSVFWILNISYAYTMMIKNGPASLNAINSAGEIHLEPLDATQSPLQETVSGPAPGASSQKSSLKSVGIVFS